jgi:transcriptional regulator with XRE-family HTH domain
MREGEAMRDLRELREAAGLTAEQLAEKVGVGPRAVVGWERGARVPTPRQVGQLALALGTTPEAVQAALRGHGVRRLPA